MRKVPPNFHGKKGRSGRKGYGIEKARERVLKKSWNILDTRLENVDDLNVALPIALKSMTEKKEISGSEIKIIFDPIFNDPSRLPKKDSGE
jgi:hypothetical protein